MSTRSIVIRLRIEGDILPSNDLVSVAKYHNLHNLRALLEEADRVSERLASSMSVEEILRRERAARKTKFPPLHSLTHYWRLQIREEDNPDEILARLRGITNEIADAYESPDIRNSCPNNLATIAADLSGQQSYLDAAPTGVDARWAWGRYRGRGENVRVIDLEAGWILTHDDLSTPLLHWYDNVANNRKEQDHGAAVMGVIGGRNDGTGVIGIAHNLDSLNAVSHYRQIDNTRDHVVKAITAAMLYLRRGDILVLEAVHHAGRFDYPVEKHPDTHTAIRLAVAAGIVVIEAAGNSSLDIDTEIPSEDSGAIMVGAGKSALSGSPQGHERHSESNHGSRVNCYAWGDGIFTAGYGDLNGAGSGADDSYTAIFDYTSGATAIIAGVAAVVQSWVKGRCIRPLNSERMREVLEEPTTGTPQTSAATPPPDPVGVMPDLRKILGWNLWLKVVGWCLASHKRVLVQLPYIPGRRQKEFRNE